MNAVRKELISIGFWTALARHRQNRLDFVGISRADVQRMRDQKQRGFGMGGWEAESEEGTDRWSRLWASRGAVWLGAPERPPGQGSAPFTVRVRL